MSTFVAVLPSIHPPYTWTCLRSMHPAFRQHTHVIDNTRRNAGVPASWNAGIARMRHLEAEWLGGPSPRPGRTGMRRTRSTKVEVEVTIESFAHGLQLAGVTADPDGLADYYAQKWGGGPGDETFPTPFDSGRPLSWWPEPERS